MPWIAKLEGDTVIPEGVEDGVQVECADCNDSMYPRGPTSDGRARHFYHPGSATGVTGGSCGGGGESVVHRKWKSLVVSRLKQVYVEEEWERCGPEVVLNVEDTETDVEFRQADALLEFTHQHHRLGNGLIVEVQYRNDGKDIAGTTQDYLQLGYSVVWVGEEDFSTERCLLDKPEFEARAETVFPTQVPAVSDWEPREYDLPPVHRQRSSHAPARSGNESESESESDAETPTRQHALTAAAYGVPCEPMPARSIKLPKEWHEARAREYFRDTPWRELFDSYVWDTDDVRDEWGEMAAIDELEVKFPFDEWYWRATAWEDRFPGPTFTTSIRMDYQLFQARQDWCLSDDVALAFPETRSDGRETAVPLVKWLADDNIYWVAGDDRNGRTWTLDRDIDDFTDVPTLQVRGELSLTDVVSYLPAPLVADAERATLRNLGADEEERVLSIVRHNTGDPQPTTIAQHHVLTIASNANIAANKVRRALRKLVGAGVLEEPAPQTYRVASESDLRW